MIHLDKECVIADLESTVGEDVLKEIITAMHQVHMQIDPVTALAFFMDREQIGSTGIGNGVAIPHGVVPNLERSTLCFGRSKKGVSFDAVDNQPVYCFAGLFFPVNVNDEYLKILAWASHFLRNKANRVAIMEAINQDEIFEILKVGGAETD